MKFLNALLAFEIVFISSIAIYASPTQQWRALIFIVALAVMLKFLSGSEKIAASNVREMLAKHMPEASRSFSILFARGGKLWSEKNFFLALIHTNGALYKVAWIENGEEKIEKLNGSKLRKTELHLGRETQYYSIIIRDCEIKYVAITEMGEEILNPEFTVVAHMTGGDDANDLLPLRMSQPRLVFKR